ncbi:MAG: GlxA family transcriptional regulator [Rhodospirillaceae bacterium]|nr:GlxA family transcriptional regulator [Rhodospirillaceae bacterium]
MRTTSVASETASVGFLLIPNFSMIAFSTAVEPIRIANRLSGTPLYSWTVISKDGWPVRASNGIGVNVDRSMEDLKRDYPNTKLFDILVVCSGLGVERYRDDDTFAWLRRIERQGTKIGAVCTGAYVLARAKLLDGYSCAIHWENLPGFMETFPDIAVSADLFEVDRNRLTSSGGTAALDMMLHLISENHGSKLATAVSEQCLLDRMRSPHDRQRLPLRARLGIHNPTLISAIEMMEANIAEPLAQDELARFVGLSRRQLERLFRKHLGRSPGQYYMELRLDRARHLLYQSEMPIVDVALASGFVSASHFSKCYRQMYGRSPRDERVTADT